MKEIYKKLLNFLSQKGALRENQVVEIENVLKGQADKDIHRVLVKGGFVEADNLAQLEAEFFNFAYVNLMREQIDKNTITKLPFNLAQTHKAILFEAKDDNVKVALADAEDYNAREAIDFWAASKGLQVNYFLCSITAFEDKIKGYGAFGQEFENVLTSAAKKKEASIDEDVSTENIEEVIKSAPVAKIVSMILKYAVESRASDIHFEPYKKSSRVRFRIDGILQTVLTLPDYLQESVVARIKVIANLKLDETRVPQDGRFKAKVGSIDYDFRVSVMPLTGNEKVTLRLLDTSGKALTLEQLGFSKNLRDIVDQAMGKTFGMILVTGPTGSGKSTTLFALLSMLNKEGVNISTLEDPIEYYMAGINQAQIRPEVKFTFASGLRALLRQDPDIIMVGEIRDSETAEMAVHAALTGHLLFSTLHTNDSVGAVPRLVDMKVEPFLMASTINLVIAQRLTRRICSKCKEAYDLPDKVTEKIKQELQTVPKDKLPKDLNLTGKLQGYRGKGCPVCKNTGYSGRVVLAEALPITDEMRRIIAEGFKQTEVKQELAGLGLINLLQDGILKALQGVTTLEDVFRVSKEVDEQE